MPLLTRRQLQAVLQVTWSKMTEDELKEFRLRKRVERASRMSRSQMAEELVLLFDEVQSSQETAQRALEAALKAQIELAKAQNDILTLELRLQGAHAEVATLNDRIFDLVHALHRRMNSVEMATGIGPAEPDLFAP
jgi:capsule polysaccharide export protein KpsE/RkpR